MGDLSGTSLEHVGIDLGQSDGAVDAVNIAGTAADDAIAVSGAAGAVAVAGLPAAVALRNAESADRLRSAAAPARTRPTARAWRPNTIGLDFVH